MNEISPMYINKGKKNLCKIYSYIDLNSFTRATLMQRPSGLIFQLTTIYFMTHTTSLNNPSFQMDKD